VSERESDLCARFRTAAEADGWVVYPEVSGWDLVLVWPGVSPVPDGEVGPVSGDQVGVHAKLRANADVLWQALTAARDRRRPDYATVLVRVAGEAFRRVASELGLGVYTDRHCGPWSSRRCAVRPRKRVVAPATRIRDGDRLWLPPVVSDAPAGVPSPSALTPWRVQALRLCGRLRERGYVTRRDFSELGISPTTWLADGRWLVRDGSVGSLARYVAAPGRDLPDRGFKAELEAILRVDADQSPRQR
jgi:hypothetical protein